MTISLRLSVVIAAALSLAAALASAHPESARYCDAEASIAPCGVDAPAMPGAHGPNESGEQWARNLATVCNGDDFDRSATVAGETTFLADRVYDAIRAGRWIDAVAFALLCVVALARRYGSRFFPRFRTRSGGWSLNVGLAAIAAVATALLGGASITVGTALDALLLALAAAGGCELVKDSKRARGTTAPSGVEYATDRAPPG